MVGEKAGIDEVLEGEKGRGRENNDGKQELRRDESLYNSNKEEMV